MKSATALRVAHVAAVEKLIVQAKDADRKAFLGRALERAKSMPDDVD